MRTDFHVNKTNTGAGMSKPEMDLLDLLSRNRDIVYTCAMYSQCETTKISKNYAPKWGFLTGGYEGMGTKIWDVRLFVKISGIIIPSHSASMGL